MPAFDDNLSKFLTNISQMKQVPVYIAEIAPKNLRGGLATTNQVRERRIDCNIFVVS